MINCAKVVISSQAYLAIVAETYTHLETETGGILLGKVVDNVWYVLETLDPGYSNISRRPAYFEYDANYVTHLANVRARLYRNGLELIGLWHRHPGSFDRFSATDDATHLRYTRQNPRGAISALINLDPHFRITMYHVAPPTRYNKVQNVVIGDSHIPNDFLLLKKPEDFMNFGHQETTTGERKRSFFSNLFKTQKEGAKQTKNTQQQESVLEMLEFELDDYLEKQSDYTYQMKMHENGIIITMHYAGQMPYYPAEVKYEFFMDGDKKKCNINGEEKIYSKGIIRTSIDKCVRSRMEEFDEQARQRSVSDEEDQKERYYAQLLDLAENYNVDDIKKKYREKLHDFHPDKWQHEENERLTAGAIRETQKIREAYDFFRKKYEF